MTTTRSASASRAARRSRPEASADRPASPLVDAATLWQALDSPGGDALVLIDAGFDLAAPAAGERAWAAGHLPGARYAHLERDLSAPKAPLGPGFTGRHPLPSRRAFAATAGRWGVTPASAVVAMDRQGGMFAARLWWMLRWLGHGRVWVLDGGVPAWATAGGVLTTETPPVRPAASYPLGTPTMPTIDADALLGCLGRVRLLDARAPERFRGDVEPLDAAAGHIPGALNRPFKDNLDADGRFWPADALRRDFAALVGTATPGDVVHQCGSGVTACHNLLAMEAAGLPGGTLYPGSWSEWSADPDRPRARG